MKRYICIATTIATVAFCAVAEDATADAAETQDKAVKAYQRTGGHVVKPGSQLGTVTIVNAQSKVTTPEFEGTIEKLRYKMRFNFKLVDGTAVDVSSAKAAKEALKTNVAVFIVDNEALPVSLVALEERWGIVNIAKLGKPDMDKVRRFGRANAELMRIIAYVCGGGESQFAESLLTVGDSPSSWDIAQRELPIDTMNKMAASLAKIGVTPSVSKTYRTACREGWAAAPTNDVQQAIWDEVKAKQAQKPTKPLKITPDMKPQGK